MEFTTQMLLYLFAAVKKAWSQETSADRARWTPDNPAWGQCAVTALVVQDFLEGSLKQADLSTSRHPRVASMRSHYFNHVPIESNGSSRDIDFTVNQFDDKKELFQLCHQAIIKHRDYLLPASPSPEQLAFKKRYKLLRLRVAQMLADNNPIFQDPIYQE